jgi:hypothetical protein
MQAVESNHGAVTRSGVSNFVLALGSSRIGVASIFFVLAFLVRFYFVLTHPEFDNVFSVRGVPYSDGQTWVSAAINLARGEGLGSVYRPGLSLLLAFFYVWLGTSFSVVTGLNLLIGAFTAALVYLVGERVLTRGIASAAALFFAFDPSQLNQMPQATTEPLGLMFFVGSVYCLLESDRHKKLRLSFLGGTLLALSNLTRPLTFPCAPFYACYLLVLEWLQTKKVRGMLLPAAVFCLGIVLTLSPWLVRQRLVYGVWAVSTNMSEALYGATSPKYTTWKYTVRAEADRAGIAPTIGARYNYFMSESLKNIRQYPSFYAGQISRSYWAFLNCFGFAARSDTRMFEYRQWSGLVEAQILFFLLLSGFLFMLAMRLWICSGILAGGLFALVSTALLATWHFAPIYAGAIILLLGLIMGLWRCQRRGIVLLAISLAVSGLSDAVFNNAILYRAVLMTDWIVSLFYLAAFCFSATLITEMILPKLGKDSAVSSTSVAQGSELQSVLSFERTVRIALAAILAAFGVFVLAASIRLVVLNFGERQSSGIAALQLSPDDKREVIAQLRNRVPTLRAVLPDPQRVNLNLVEAKPAPASSAPAIASNSKLNQDASANRTAESDTGKHLVIFAERLSPFLFYFPVNSEFEARDRLFKRRQFSCTILRASRFTAIFPGKIPSSLREQEVIFVGWNEGVHAIGGRPGEVMQCVAIIPVLKKGSEPDYEHAITVKPRRNIL